jgi:hypothetical protein
MFGFKKKQPLSLPELPPPPSPPDLSQPQGDLPEIKPSAETMPELPELPAAPSFEHEPELEAPAPELPEAPVPEAEVVEKKEEYAVPEPAELTPVEEPEVSVFDRTLAAPERTVRPVGPVFVSVDEYRAIMENSNRVRAKLMEAEEFMQRLNEIKAEEEKAFERWRGQLEDVERKLGHIDRVIAKAQR